MYNQSLLRDRIISGSRSNSGSGFFILSQIEISQKSGNPGDRDLRISEKLESKIPKIPKSRGSGLGFEKLENSDV